MSSHSPRRIVSLQPSATVTLQALGLLGRLVACTKYCVDVCPEVGHQNCVIVEDSWTAQAQQILSAKPDLVIASVPYQEKAVVEILKSGVRFLGLAPHSLADIYSDIATIAGAVGDSGRAAVVIADMQREIAAIQSRARTASFKPRVFCEEWGKPIIQSQVWVAEMIGFAGGEFVGEPGKVTSAGEIERQNPDVILAAWCGAGGRVPLERMIRERQWTGTTAAKTGRVFCIRDEFLNTPAPTLLHGLRAIAYAVHPELFQAVDGIRQIAQQVSSSTVVL